MAKQAPKPGLNKAKQPPKPNAMTSAWPICMALFWATLLLFSCNNAQEEEDDLMPADPKSKEYW